MTNPTGKLKFAYDTLRNLEAEIAALKQALAQPDHPEDLLDMVAAEREACALVCEARDRASVWDVATLDCAAAIRQRSQS